MNKAHLLRDLGQSLWPDNITREILVDGTPRHYIDEYAIPGLTSNPTIFEHTSGNTGAFDKSIRDKTARGESGEALFVELALEHLSRLASTSAHGHSCCSAKARRRS
ncbi:MAG: transaldolase family protein [Betaproteobacteria bacterium]